MSNTYRYRWGPKILRWVDKTGTVAIEQGDMIMLIKNTGKVKAVSASGDANDLIGIAMGASPTTDTTATAFRMAVIGRGTVFEMTVASSTYTFGDTFLISAKQLLLEKAVDHVENTSTNIVAICAQDLDTAGTKLLVEFLAPTPLASTIKSS